LTKSLPDWPDFITATARQKSYNMHKRGKLYLGTSGLVLPFKNRNAYPPHMEGLSRLEIYGTLFNSIEINSIFYKLPKHSTVKQWADSVGDTFRFTFKLWKQITHCPGLNFDPGDLDKYFEVIEGAGSKSGCILVQFPPSIKFEQIDQLALLLSSLQARNTNNLSLAVEYRNASWYVPQTYELLQQLNASMVDHDKLGSPSPHVDLNTDHTYLRFHGPGGNYKGSYDEGFLYEYAGYGSQWTAETKTLYVYFNNTMGSALQNLKTFEKYYVDLCEEAG
jgi:uncharacterized protein YecE (DUF72 family)